MLETKQQRIIAGVAAAVVVLGGVAAALVVTGDDPPPPTTTAPPTTLAPTTTVPPPVAPLTGLPTDAARASLPALFVKIDNVPKARPQAGLNQADIVFEERVEGNVTRLAAVFQSTDADPVGPVRSTRTTDIDVVSLLGRPIYASSGGNRSVMSQLAAAGVLDVGHNVSGGGFRRDPGRPAPHDLFTSTQALYAKAPEQPPPPKPLFAYSTPAEPLGAGAVPAGGVALRFGGAEISRFTWSAAQRVWLRSQSGTPHLDSAGAQVAPQNVVVLEIAYDLSGGGRSVPHGITTGEGRALVFTQGHVIEGRWVRPTRDHPLQLLAPDGAPIKLTPGRTFVELPPQGGAAVL